jgi:hypothetical protein
MSHGSNGDGGMNPRPMQPLSRAQSRDIARSRRSRNIALLIVLLCVAGLFYAVAIVKMTSAPTTPTPLGFNAPLSATSRVAGIKRPPSAPMDFA